MPTPDGREWLNPSAIADRIVAVLAVRLKDVPIEFGYSQTGMETVKAAIEEAYRATGYETEFKIVRLLEKFKDRVSDGTISTMEQVRRVLIDIYDKDALDLLDEDGEPLP